MKKLHRALALFFAFLIMSLHLVSAHAVEVQEDTFVEPFVARNLEGDYSRLRDKNDLVLYALALSAENDVSLMSLDEETLDRSWYTSASVDYGGWFDHKTLAVGTKTFSWQGNGFYRLASYSGSDKEEVWCRIYMNANSYQDWIVNATLVYEDGALLQMNGTVKYTMQCGWFNQNAFVSNNTVQYVSDACIAVPDRLGIIVNGDVIQTFEVGADGSVDLAFEYPMTGNVNSLGYRWYYDTEVHLLEEDFGVTDVQTRGLYAEVVDNAVVSVYVADPVVSKIDEVKQAVVQLPSTIYNFFFGEDGDEVAEGFKSEVDGVIESGDEVREEFEALEKPDPLDTIPDKDAIIPQEEFQAYTAVFADVLQSKLVLPLMVMALSMALMAYVVYGKKG